MTRRSSNAAQLFHRGRPEAANEAGLRLSAISCALDLNGGDIRSVQRFSRHNDMCVLQTHGM
jgi:hypothetical protein